MHDGRHNTSLGMLLVTGTFYGNYGLGNQYGDYVILSLVAYLSGRKFHLNVKGTFPLYEHFRSPDDSMWGGSPKRRDTRSMEEVLFASRRPECTRITEALLFNTERRSVSMHINKNNALMFLPFCTTDTNETRVWPDENATLQIQRLVGDRQQKDTYPPWRSLLQSPHSTLSRVMRKALATLFTNPSPQLRRVFDAFVSVPSARTKFLALHVRTGISDERPVASQNPVAQKRDDASLNSQHDRWNGMNNGCTHPQAILRKALIASVQRRMPIVVISDSPHVCSTMQWAARAERMTPSSSPYLRPHILCPSVFSGIGHSVQRSHGLHAHHSQTVQRDMANLNVALHMYALMRAEVVYEVGHSTFAYWATVRQDAFGVSRPSQTAAFLDRKVIPVCSSCDDASSYATISLECNAVRQAVFA
jgi:hypothetical protein